MNSRLMALKDAKGQQATHLVGDISRVHTPHEAIVIKANMATRNGAGTNKISKSKPINFTLMAASSFLAGCRSLVFGLWSVF